MTVKQLLQTGDSFIVPGVFDALSAKLAEKAGAKILALTGYSVSATQMGEPDIGVMTQSEVIQAAKIICNAVNIPVIIDGDTGYGGPLNVMRLVKELIQIGASGVILEDQLWPKRCGHMDGKAVIPSEEFAEKIKAARIAAKDTDFVIIARTDARATHNLEEAINRGKLYHQSGADVVFVEAPQSRDEIIEISQKLKNIPLLINMIEGGKTPLMTLDEIQTLKFNLITYPLTGILAAGNALLSAYRNLIQTGVGSIFENGMNFAEFNELIGLNEKQQLLRSLRE